MNAAALSPGERADLLLCARRSGQYQRATRLATGGELAERGLVEQERQSGKGEPLWRPTPAGARLAVEIMAASPGGLSALSRLRQELSAEGGKLRERAPHVATRVVVDVDGQPFVRALYAFFDQSNRLHFDGALSAPLIFVSHTAPRALGDHAERDAHGLRSVIRLHPRAVARGLAFANDILLHEMVHTWQVELAGDAETGYRGHGPKFAEQCNAIGGRLGLALVGLKGRKGLPDCAQWPVCVRPAGYYGNAEAEAEREKRVAPRKPKGPTSSPAIAPDFSGGDAGDAGDDVSPNHENELAAAAAVCERYATRAGRTLERLLRRAAAALRELAA
ncbi:MAG: SprT-like domain-containing protein [Gaiellaceae bacterium]